MLKSVRDTHLEFIRIQYKHIIKRWRYIKYIFFSSKYLISRRTKNGYTILLIHYPRIESFIFFILRYMSQVFEIE